MEYAVYALENQHIKEKYQELKKQAGKKGGKKMTTTDPIADMLTRIRNANQERHATVDIPYSKTKKAIADILLNEGFVKAVDVLEEGTHKTKK